MEISRFPSKRLLRMPDPMGGGRRPALWQSEVATTHSGDGHACCSSSTRSAGRHPQRSWRNFRFVGTQPLNLADHFAVALRRREDVEAQRAAGDIGALLARFSEFKQKAFARTGKSFPIIVIQEAGLDGFWIYRVLQSEGIESHVVDPASIATSRRRRRAKTDRIDGEALLRALLAYKRGEPRVCAMVKAPTPEEEDRRRLSRERKTLIGERVEHVNRIKGLLFCQGVSDYEPLRRNRRQRLDELKTGDGRALPDHLKAQISRELDRLELLLEQIKAVEAGRRHAARRGEGEGANTSAGGDVA